MGEFPGRAVDVALVLQRAHSKKLFGFKAALVDSEDVKKLAADIHARVAPFLTPRFLRHCCQAPQSFVLWAALLSQMWQGEDLGNFAAHKDGAVAELRC